jgi:hypothetical protein
VRAVKTPGFEQYVIRSPYTKPPTPEQMDTYLKSDPRFLIIDHPLAHRPDLGVPLARIGQPANSVEIQRRVPGIPVAKFYEKWEEKISPISSLITTCTSEAEFKTKLDKLLALPENATLKKDYQRFQKRYSNLIKQMADLPQSAYNDVAKTIKTVQETGYRIDLNHGNNILFDTKKSRFNFVDIDKDINNPFYSPHNMDGFMVGALTNSDFTQGPGIFQYRRFLIQDPSLSDSYKKNFQMVVDKIQAAQKILT